MDNRINGQSRVLAVIGDPIEHSFSPQIHNTLCTSLALNYVYVPFRIVPDCLGDAIRGFKAMGVAGFNITIPHKSNVIAFLDEVDREAFLMGAVNTVKNIDGKLHGYNTDGIGLVKSLSTEGIAVAGQHILILGAGGAARGIAVKFALEGAASIVILNRTVEKAEEICELVNRNIKNICKYDEINHMNRYLKDVSLLINTTSVGMYPKLQECPMADFSMLQRETAVCDLIYNPKKTIFLQKAEEKGCKIVNGWGMLVYQAISAFEIWTGVEVDRSLIGKIQYGA